MRIDRIDHLVLTVDDIERTIAFYVDVLDMTEVTFGSGRKALTFGTTKINLHQRGREYEPKAASPRKARSSALAPRDASSASTSATQTAT